MHIQNKILLTGITGFIGSHIAEFFANKNIEILALIRKKSNLHRCQEFNAKNIKYFFYEDGDLNHKLKFENPNILIHTAWNGVSANERQNWNNQISNINILAQLFEISQNLKLDKFISLGSQAEYGFFEGRVDESLPTKPNTPYGASKLASQVLLSTYCNEHKIDWYWLRLFSVYGSRESNTWLIPSVINKAIKNIDIELTGCEQKYDYLYINDLCLALLNIIKSIGNSGIYNLTSNSSLILKDLIELIRKISKTQSVIKYGALPYRNNQVMHMEGNSNLFNNTFDFKINSDLNQNLYSIYQYYKTFNI